MSRPQVGACLLAVLLSARPGTTAAVRWVLNAPPDFAALELDGVRVLSDSMVVLGLVDGQENLALGRSAVDEFGRSVPLTDGEVGTGQSEWLSGTPNVYGRYFIVDLGMDRAITRVRIRAGGSALAQPEYYIRGYRLEAATAAAESTWRLLAEDRENLRLNVDTEVDSTWAVRDALGQPQPRIGRYVRLTLVRQDRSNWVAIGDIEVNGAGLAAAGAIRGVLRPDRPVNVGRIGWESRQPAGTDVVVSYRGSVDGTGFADWVGGDGGVENGGLFDGIEPVAALQFRAGLASSSAYVTPQLREVVVEYDPVLVAAAVAGAVTPDTVARAATSAIEYRVQVACTEDDYGVDMVRLRGVPFVVREVRRDGVALTLSEDLRQGYRWSTDADAGLTVLELAAAERIAGAGTLEIDLEGVFLRDRTDVDVAVGSLEQAARDGYINWQQGAPAPGGTWTVMASGAPMGLLSGVDVAPRPFSPYAAGTAEFSFVVGNLQGEAEIRVEVYTVAGQRVWRMVRSGSARPYVVPWDGRNLQGQVVDPGLYVYVVQVEAGNYRAARRGALAVAY